MIQANELRIGNYIYLPSQTENFAVKVNRVSNDNVNGFDFSETKGIELTEDWLLKFGFEEQTPKYFVLDLGDFSMRYYYNFSGSTWKFELEDKTLKIKFVHQFQNLYFALTQKELILK